MARRICVRTLIGFALAMAVETAGVQAADLSASASSGAALAAIDQALLLASVPDSIAYISYGNGSLTLQSAAALVLDLRFVLTMADWLPANTSTITRAWAGASTAAVKKM